MVRIGGEDFVAKGLKRRRMGWELKHFITVENRRESAMNGSGAETTLQNRQESERIGDEWRLNHRESATNGSRIGDEWNENRRRMGQELKQHFNRRESAMKSSRIDDEWVRS